MNRRRSEHGVANVEHADAEPAEWMVYLKLYKMEQDEYGKFELG